MKKTIIRIFNIALIGTLFLLNACTDTSEVVYHDLLSEEFIPTPEDAVAITGPAYTNLREVLFYWHGMFDTQEECSDIIVTPERPNGWVDGGVYRAMHEHIWNSEQSHSSALWNRCYTGINHCNRALYQIESGNLPMDPDDAVKTLAELKVVRAFYYYILLDNFGNVPVTTQYDVPEDFLPEQSTRQEVYNFVIQEINDNMENLPAENNVETYGRFNQWAAHTLLAKVYQNAEVYTGTAQWAKCIEECDAVITSNLYSLEPDVRNTFKTNNESSVEIIFAVPFASKSDPFEDYGWFHLLNKTLHPGSQATYDLEVQPWGGNCAIPQFINTYHPNDDRLAATWIMGPQFALNGDTVYLSMDDARTSEQLNYTNILQGIEDTYEEEGYRIGKYEIAVGTKFGRLENDWVWFRYADILMMKAEALLRTGDADGAATLVTEVRLRAFDDPADAEVTGAELQAGSSYEYGNVTEGVLEASPEGGADIQYGRFLDELGWEFAAEARRRQDLIRFGVFTTKKWLSHVPNGDFRTIFPIPETALQTNSNLVQNPGY
ncbi:MAG: RagB/SusD family nutrient uptake outer membrane protein [Bacteroidales bacterium]|nr:RagB/SusD family nutrient uptake outer membrane protein [Bacteroidales bacterium]